MKTLATIIGTIAPTTAFSAVNAPLGDNGIFVWIFLGFCALIVVTQLIPAIILIIGMFRGITAKNEVKHESKL